MAILSKGTTFATGDSVTSTKLNNLVDASTFASGAVDGTTTDLSGGSIIVKNGGITPTKLSTGAPTWTTGSNFTVQGTITAGGQIATSNGLDVAGATTLYGSLDVRGTIANATFSSQIIAAGTSTGRTVPMKTASGTPNVISFGWDSVSLLVTIDGTNYKVALTPV